MTNAVSASLWISLAGTALLASLGPVATVQTNADVRAMLALMHVSAAIVLLLGLRRTVPGHRSVETVRSHS
jgi:Family of unknown function (DUF6069)